MNDVRAISVKQPWADAIVDSHKPVENRSHGFPRGYRGMVIVHASLAISHRGATDPRILEVCTRDPDEWVTGAAIGHAELVDAHDDTGCCRPWGESVYQEIGGKLRRNLVHLVFENPVRYDYPIPCRGALGLWKPTPVVLEACGV